MVWSVRRWLILLLCVTTAVAVAVVVRRDRPPADPHVHAAAQQTRQLLTAVDVFPHRLHRNDYQRSAFGSAWTDAVSVAGGGNGCDTRNDILGRDLVEVHTGAVDTCGRAVLTGRLRSPYTGEWIVFRRGRTAGAVQIDHIVALALAWDMGAWAWPADRRADLANDPANLIAVDAASNQAKSDAPPGRWMPPLAAFRCRYAIQFVTVVAAYGLAVDADSREVLDDVLARC